MKSKNVRLISKITGLSPATVSRYFNGHPYISKEAKKKIKAAINKIDSNLTINNEPKEDYAVGIGYFARKETLSYYSEVFDELLAALKKEGIRTVRINIRPEEQKVKEIIDCSNDLKCIIIIGSVTPAKMLEEISSVRPVIVIDNIHSRVHSVNLDNFSGVYYAVEYLISLGHRNIAFLGASKTKYSFNCRYLGYSKAIKKYGLKENVEFYKGGDYYNEGKDMLKSLLDNQTLFSALISSGELITAGIINELKEYRLDVPKDVSVIGFGNSNISKNFFPPITSIGLMEEEISHWTVQIVKNLILGKNGLIKIVIQPELMVRETCAKNSEMSKLKQIYKQQ